MPQTLESVKRRIDSVEDLLSIVRTMKTLAAVNIRQYEKGVLAVADYNHTVEMGLQVALQNRPAAPYPTPTSDAHPLGALVLGSDQGMCGQFNEQVASYALAQLGNTPQRILLSGGRLLPLFEAAQKPIDLCLPIASSISGISSLIQEIILRLDLWRSEQGAGRVLLFYNQPIVGALYRPQMLTLLPINLERFAHLAAKPWGSRRLPTFSMDWQPLIAALIRQYVFIALYRAVVASLMSENTSRLATMQAAERNISERLEQLHAEYHQHRQRAITEELLDVVAGFESIG